VSLATVLADFRAEIAQCDSLVAAAHKTDAGGIPVFTIRDQKQVTVAAYLNLYIAWEMFLESAVIELMLGNATISGNLPVRYVTPRDATHANALVIGVRRPHFDFGNHENVRALVANFFHTGYPFEPHVSALISDLNDMKTIRNACAHVSSTTQKALIALATRILGAPPATADVHVLLTALDPRAGGGSTVFSGYRDKLLVAAQLIAQG
jgi:hypothetical protein